MQQAYGKDATGRTKVFDWFRPFKAVEPSLKATRARETIKKSCYWLF
jgi:hypothetical protein